jgi:predicted O-methyltransferase YrrM
MIERARSAAADVAGWLTDAEGALLCTLANSCPPSSTIVEIGSFHGKSTIWLANGARTNGGRIFAIDPHEGSIEDPEQNTLPTLLRNLVRAGVEDIVTPIVARSSEATGFVDRPYQLLFIDGDHTDAGVRLDLDVWMPRLVVGGTVALHDVINPRYGGPRRALIRVLWRARDLGRVQFVDSIAYAPKVAVNTAGDRMSNALAAIALAAYGLRPSHIPPPFARGLRWLARLTPLKRASGGQ